MLFCFHVYNVLLIMLVKFYLFWRLPHSNNKPFCTSNAMKVFNIILWGHWLLERERSAKWEGILSGCLWKIFCYWEILNSSSVPNIFCSLNLPSRLLYCKKTQTIKHAQKEFSNSKVTTQNVEKAYTVVTKISTLRKTWDLIVFEEGDSCQYFKKCQM